MNLVKTKLRGWIHAFTAPLALANAIVLICLAPTPTLKWACAAFGLCSLILFGISATYHLGTWNPIVLRTLKRMDHSNIFLLIAGTYTPLAISGLSGASRTICLSVVWGGAIAGILMEVFWVTAPRVLRVVVYVLLGWVAIWFMPQFWVSEGPAVVWLLLAGGLCYTIGAVFYAIKKPNPWPRYFGFHEFFHTGTVLGYSCHVVAIWLALMA
ncbi:MAG: hemolysin III family protein [Arcanobacterium sp.]|nr:hemolysin III family protein [Arcanobacterium sp.]